MPLQARHAADGRGRSTWLALAAVSIGGVGIWLMHFVAMLGFATPGAAGAPRRAADVVVGGAAGVGGVPGAAGVAAAVGVATARRRAGHGLAVNLMHWTGMWAVRIKGEIGYHAGPALTSVAIVLVAATVALWIAAAVDRPGPRVLAGLVMGAAVTGMHYVGMAVMYVRLTQQRPTQRVPRCSRSWCSWCSWWAWWRWLCRSPRP